MDQQTTKTAGSLNLRTPDMKGDSNRICSNISCAFIASFAVLIVQSIDVLALMVLPRLVATELPSCNYSSQSTHARFGEQETPFKTKPPALPIP